MYLSHFLLSRSYVLRISWGSILSTILIYSSLFIGLSSWKFLTSTIKYFPFGVDRNLFQWSLAVVKYDVGVETGTSNESLSPPTVSGTLWVSVFWDLMLHTMRLYVTLFLYGTSSLWIKKICIGALDTSDYLKKLSYLISKCSCPFWFVRPFH